MLKNKTLLDLLLLSLLALWGCTEDVMQESENMRSISMTASDFEYEPDSRTTITVSPQGGKFTWAAGDTVGIFPNEGYQVPFPIKDGQNTKTASFSGGGWALRPSSKYMAYYPMKGDFYLDKRAIPVSFAGQVQKGNASTAHLGLYDYMAASASAPELESVNFEFEHLVSLVELTITLPKKIPLSSVTLNADAPIFVIKGKVDLTANAPAIIPVTTSKVLSIGMDGTKTAQQTVYKIYFTTAPINLTDRTIKVVAMNENGGYSGYVSVGTKVLQSGRIYAWSATLSDIVNDCWVDLGLSVKWASHNVGASQPEEYGQYFAWGEITPKASYTEANSLTFGVPFGNIADNADYDAARANWGKPARMPTQEEMDELIKNTTHEWTSMKNVWGYKFTSKKNKNSIFLPAAGFYSGNSILDKGTNGYYWSATPNVSNAKTACRMTFLNVSLDWGWFSRGYGRSVRPVLNKE